MRIRRLAAMPLDARYIPAHGGKNCKQQTEKPEKKTGVKEGESPIPTSSYKNYLDNPLVRLLLAC
eukprot:323367-Pelagomonas_calceolata.AAC.1